MNTYGLSLSVPETLRRRLDAYARRAGVSRSEASRRLLVEGLDRDLEARRGHLPRCRSLWLRTPTETPLDCDCGGGA